MEQIPFMGNKGMAKAIPLFILLCGCTAGTYTVSQGAYNGTPSSFYIKGVPFFPQERYRCGPASLAGILNYYGISVSEEEVANKVYNPKLNGTIPPDILKYARTKGFDATYYKGSIQEIKREIADGRPVIMFLNLGYSFYPVRHYIVATGYDDEKGHLIAHSGKEKDKIFSYREIQRAWEKTGFGTILILPKKN